MTGGAVSMEMVQGVLSAVNGHFWRGITRLVIGYFKNRKSNHAYEKLLNGGKER